jgi:hypothetical protein
MQVAPTERVLQEVVNTPKVVVHRYADCSEDLRTAMKHEHEHSTAFFVTINDIGGGPQNPIWPSNATTR